MGIEIEHKYLVKDDTYKEMASKCYIIRQGYLNRDPERTVRVRIKGDEAFLTVKGRNKGDVRLEFEYQIPYTQALEMLELCQGRVIEKKRYIVKYGDYQWEIDEFMGDLNQLVLAEIELSESGHSYPIPHFIGEEVTGDPSYYNSML